MGSLFIFLCFYYFKSCQKEKNKSHPFVVVVCSLQESLLSLVYVQRPHWKCFQYQGSFSPEEVRREADRKVFTPSLSFLGLASSRPLRFPTRDCLPTQTPENLKKIDDKLQCLRQGGVFLVFRVYLFVFI